MFMPIMITQSAFSLDIDLSTYKGEIKSKNKKFCSAHACTYACVVRVLTTVYIYSWCARPHSTVYLYICCARHLFRYAYACAYVVVKTRPKFSILSLNRNPR